MTLTQTSSDGYSIRWSLGELMRKARKDAGLEQQQVAEALGVSRALVGHWENDRSEPTYRKLMKFAELTGFPLDVLLSAIGYNLNTAGEAPIRELIEGGGKSRGRSLPIFVRPVQG